MTDDIVEIDYDVEQKSDAWRKLRLGLPTASVFKTIMANGKDGGDSLSRAKLLRVLAGEILSGEPSEDFNTLAMARGVQMEPEARDYYARTNFATLTKVGFVKRTFHNPMGPDFVAGCSPDSLIGEHKALEIKTTRPDLLIEIAMKGAAGFPREHMPQCQGTLWITGRAEIDLMIFYRGMPVAPTFTIERDDRYIQKLREAVETFAYELRKLVDRIRGMAR